MRGLYNEPAAADMFSAIQRMYHDYRETSRKRDFVKSLKYPSEETLARISYIFTFLSVFDVYVCAVYPGAVLMNICYHIFTFMWQNAVILLFMECCITWPTKTDDRVAVFNEIGEIWLMLSKCLIMVHGAKILGLLLYIIISSAYDNRYGLDT